MIAAVTFLMLLASANAGTAPSEMFSWGTSVGDLITRVTGMFDQPALLDFYTQVTIPTTASSFKIFGANLGKQIYVNYNGHITFGNFFNSFDPFKVNSTDASILAIFNVYFSDNDPRRSPGLLYTRFSTSAADLNKANALIRGRGFLSFTSEYCIIATWENLKYYVSDKNERSNPGNQEENSYQMALCTDGKDGHPIYNYNKINWGRSQDTSTNFATIGWVVKQATDPTLRYWVAPHSGTSLVTQMAVGSNVNFPGRWMRSQAITGPCVGQANGLYAVSCTQYRFCCNQASQQVDQCPDLTNYHPTLQMCVSTKLFNCATPSSFCVGKADADYVNIDTPRDDDFYRCRSGITRVMACPHSITFGTSSRCR